MKKGEDLWARALQGIRREDRQQLELEVKPRIELLADLQCLTESARDECIKKRWRFRRPDTGEVIILRDLFGKIVSWINVFKQIGDNAVQYDPQHAALPWAAVRLILQVAVSEVVKFEFVIEIVEKISRLISRYAIFEDLYLRHASAATQKLEEALVDLYASILLSLSKAKAFFLQSTTKRMLKGIFIAEEEFQDLLTKVSEGQSEVDRCALLVQTDNNNSLSDTLAALIVDGDEKHSELLRLLRLIDGPINRMGIQLQGIEDRLEASKRTKMLSWISSIPYIEHHERIKRDDVPGRGKWLLDDPVYAQWHKDSTCSLLWLHGKVGSGKTTLTAIVVDDVLRRSIGGQNPPPAYFFCSRNAAEPGRSNPDEILASLVRQLACTRQGAPLSESIIEKYERKGQGFQSRGLQLEESRELILELVDQSSMTTIVIDALDEIDVEKRYLLLEALDDILQEATGLLKIFVSSRDDQDITCTLQNYPSFDITSDDNNRDIEHFIRAETARLISKRRLLRYSQCKDELKRLIIERVCEGADGMFRWVTLQLELLCALKLDADVRATLGRLPPGLHELYAEIYERQISQHPGETGRAITCSVLKWLLCAQRTMTSFEVRTAVAINIPISVQELTVEHILNLCSNFVTYDKALDNLLFVHLSVREYLETRPEYTQVPCNLLAAEACLIQLIGSAKYSRARDFLKHEYALDLSSKVASTLESYDGGFHEYSAVNWTQHCVSIGEEGRQNQDRFQKLFRFFFFPDQDNNSPLNGWLHAFQLYAVNRTVTTSVLRKFLLGEPDNRTTSFFVACAFGFCEILREKLKDPQISADEKRNAWDIASFSVQDEALKTLLVDNDDLEISESFVWEVAENMHAETLSWVLRRAPGIKLTIGLITSASRYTRRQNSDKVIVILDHFDASQLSSEILEVAAGTLRASKFKSILAQRADIEASEAMLLKAVRKKNLDVGSLLIKDFNVTLSDSLFELVVKICPHGFVLLVLEHGEHTISSRVMSEAVKNRDDGVFLLLLTHGGIVNDSVVAMVAGYGFAVQLNPLLDSGHEITKPMLLLGASNDTDGAAMIDLLLTRGDDSMIRKESDAIMKRVAANVSSGMPEFITLKSRTKCELVSEDYFMASTLSGIQGINSVRIDNLISASRDGSHLSPEIVETIIKRVASRGLMQLMCNHLGHWTITDQILKAAAGNTQCGDDLMVFLLEKSPDLPITNDIWNAAISNRSRGLEVLTLLEKHLGSIDVTEELLVRTASSANAQVMVYLLDRSTVTGINGKLITSAFKATRRGLPFDKAITPVIFERDTNLPVSTELLLNAARNATYEDFRFITVRCAEMVASPALLQAAAENWRNLYILQFLLEEAEFDVELSEITVTTMVSNNPKAAIELLQECSANIMSFQIPYNAIIEAASDPSISKSMIKFVLKHANVDIINDDILQASASSGAYTSLKALAEHCGLSEVPLKWTDIAKLHHAATQEAWYFKSRWPGPGNEAYDSDTDISLVRDLLAEGVPCDLPDRKGATPLANAARAGNELIVKALLAAGADPNSRDRLGRSPLFHAAASGHYEIVIALLEKGVKADLVDSDGVSMAESAKNGAHMKIYRLLQDYQRTRG